MSTCEFTADGADIILRASRSDVPREFHVHKTILSTASPVFRGMFDIPQPVPSATLAGSTIPVIDVDDTPEDLDVFLHMIYPFGFPRVPTLNAISHALAMLDKYEVQGGPLQILRLLLVSREFLENEPIEVYSIACNWKLKEEADLAAFYTSSLDIISRARPEHVQRMTSLEYHRILTLAKERRSRCQAHINNLGLFSNCCGKKGCRVFYHKFRSALLESFNGDHYPFYHYGWCITRCFEIAIETAQWTTPPPAECGLAKDSHLGKSIRALAGKMSGRP